MSKKKEPISEELKARREGFKDVVEILDRVIPVGKGVVISFVNLGEEGAAFAAGVVDHDVAAAVIKLLRVLASEETHAAVTDSTPKNAPKSGRGGFGVDSAPKEVQSDITDYQRKSAE